MTDSRQEFNELFSLVYEELRRIAAAVRRNESHITLGATALVHEAWLRLKDNPRLAHTTPLHFKRIAARVIRQVLVDAARERSAQKRGGAGAVRKTLDESMLSSEDFTLDLLHINSSLRKLQEVDSRQAQLAELKIFSELTNAEIAAELGVSLATVERGWRLAKAWLKMLYRTDGKSLKDNFQL
jgi:RNA polymerase sigma factor (TIGR02999 family)